MAEHLFAKQGSDLLNSVMSAGTRALEASGPPLPTYVADFLVRLRLAERVPFNYLVPDPGLLPNESIRFFTVDDAWLDALMEGAMAVGSSGARDVEHSRAAMPTIKAAVRDAVPLAAAVRRRQVGASAMSDHVRGAVAVAAEFPDPGGTPPVTGFLLRSSLVAGWPGFSVRAFTTTEIPEAVDPTTLDPSLFVPILRMELLSPSVLLVLFAGTPALVWLEEPDHGVPLGIEEDNELFVVNTFGAQVFDVDDHGEDVAKKVSVPMRGGPVPGVVDVAGLRATLDAAHNADVRIAPQGGSAALALQLMNPPRRQRFSIAENG
jgi:hypothetical protein